MTKYVLLVDKNGDITQIPNALNTFVKSAPKGVNIDISPAKGAYKFVVTLDAPDKALLNSIVGKVKQMGGQTLSSAIG